jgi:large subunit ribosomal protein L10
MLTEKKIPPWKKEEIEYLVNLMKKYENIIVINLSGINDKQIQEMRKILRREAVIRMSKKSLQKRAIKKYEEESGKENLDLLRKKIPGQSALVFTDLDPFELKRIFLENEWMVAAKPGQEAPVDIIVPKGDTGLPTGQVISELNMILKLPTMLKNDTIHIREDTVTHEKGDIVSMKEASVLKKLGIEPIESIIKIHSAWTDGRLIHADILYMDMEQFREDIMDAHITARKVAIELEILDKETIQPLLQKAYREALSVLFELPIVDMNFIEEYVKKAEMNAYIINNMAFGGASTPNVQEKQEE